MEENYAAQKIGRLMITILISLENLIILGVSMSSNGKFLKLTNVLPIREEK